MCLMLVLCCTHDNLTMFDKGNRIEANGHEFRTPATNFFDNNQLNLAHSRDFAFLIVNVSVAVCTVTLPLTIGMHCHIFSVPLVLYLFTTF